MVLKPLTLLAFVCGSAVATAAQDVPTSPYVGIQGRVIKALAAEDVAGLLNGDGMLMALAAELNGYPGPKHVLELADSLDLSSEQRASAEVIFDRMQAAAREIGQRIVRIEQELDSLFATRAIDSDRLIRLTASVASLHGELRGEHLRAHLEMTASLSDHQVMRYQQMRGYGEAGHVHGHVPQ